MDMDKRGRPALKNRSQKNKSTMERFYEMSSESDSSESSEEKESNNEDEESVDNSNSVDTRFTYIGDGDDDTVSKNIMTKKRKPKSKNVIQNVDPDQSKKNKTKTEIPNDRPKVSQKKNVKLTEKDGSDGKEDIDSDDSEFDEQAASNSDDDSDDSEDEELPLYTGDYDLEETDHQWNELEKDAPLTSEATHRFAVCNMDWDFVKAQDLFVLFRSFVPEGGSVKSVNIYPSEFGKERMAEEVRMGPKEIREHSLKRKEDQANKKKKGKKIDEKKEKSLKKSNEEVQTEKLREYQLNRLKYYYAVVECDSVKTSDVIYTECDGREYQLSSVRLDLRFIPDDMTFDDEPREAFSEMQTVVDYQPSTFESSALSNAKVEVTWDETEFDRLSRRVGIMQQKDLESIIEDNKYADIIAPPESDSEEEAGRPEWLLNALAQESDEDSEGNSDSGQTKSEKIVGEEDKIRIYRQLLVDKAAEEEEENEKEENDVDKVMEWTPGLKSEVKKKLKKKEKNTDETAVVNDYLNKRREKKKKKRNLKKQQLSEEGEDVVSDDEEDLLEVDDSLKKMMEGEEVYEGLNKEKKKKKKKRIDEENEEDDREKAELELILMGDDDVKRFSKPEIVDDNETKSKKKRKTKKAMAKLKKGQETEKEDYVMDVEDKRFGALFSSHHFHIDPTAPQFKKTKNMMRLVDEQIKRKKSTKKRHAESDGLSDRAEHSSKSVSQSLVESLKKKMKKT